MPKKVPLPAADGDGRYAEEPRARRLQHER